MKQESNVRFRAEKEYKNSREKFFLLLREIISNAIHAVLIKKNKEENWVENLSLSEAMKHLDSREHEIISLRFFEGKTQMEVAGIINISQAQVSRLEKNALKKMRVYLS